MVGAKSGAVSLVHSRGGNGVLLRRDMREAAGVLCLEYTGGGTAGSLRGKVWIHGRRALFLARRYSRQPSREGVERLLMNAVFATGKIYEARDCGG